MVFWLCALCLQFPRTYWDDSLIVGPSISIAEWGRLENIYLSKNFYPDHPYLFYPPVFFWILSGWIIVFGKYVQSFDWFWAFSGLTSSISLALLLTRLLESKLFPWILAPILLFGCIGYTGYRFETLALATFLTGLLLCTRAFRLPGYFLLFITPTIAPTFLGVCAVTATTVFLHSSAQEKMMNEMVRASSMLLICIFLLVASVSGHIIDLILTMHHYKDVRIALGGGRDLSVASTSMIPIGLNLTSGAIQYFILKRPIKSIELFLPFIIIMSFELTLITHARPIILVSLNIATFVIAAYTIGAAAEKLSLFRNAQPSSLLTTCFGCFLAALNITYVRDVAVRPLPASLIAEARVKAAAAPSGRILVVDAQIMKEALGYPINRPIEDSMVRRPLPMIFQNYEEIPKNEHLVITRSALLSRIMPGYERPYRSLIDRMFIATGMQSHENESICVIDSEIASTWNGNDPNELVEIACT